jgi:transcriptional regulator with XRE-family HTH domain
VTTNFVLKTLIAIRGRQRELAAKVGIAPSTLCNIVAGRARPSAATARRIERELGRAPQSLFPELGQ